MSKNSLKVNNVNEPIQRSNSSNDEVDIEIIPTIIQQINNKPRKKLMKMDSLRETYKNSEKINKGLKEDLDNQSFNSSNEDNQLERIPSIIDETNNKAQKINRSIDMQNSNIIQPKNAWSNENTRTVSQPKQPTSKKKQKTNKAKLIIQTNNDENEFLSESKYEDSDLPALLILFETTFALKNDEFKMLKNCQKKLKKEYEYHMESAGERRQKLISIIDQFYAEFQADLEHRYNECSENCESSISILQNLITDMDKIDKKKDKLTDKHIKSLKNHFSRWQKEYTSMPKSTNLILNVIQPEFSTEKILDIFGTVNSATSSGPSTASSSPEKKINDRSTNFCLLSQFSCSRRKDKQACGITDVALNTIGDVFVVDKHNKTLKIFDMGGSFKNCTSKNTVKKPMRVSYLATSDKLILTDEGKNELIMYSTDLSVHKKLLALQFPVSHDYFGDNMIAVLEFNSKSIMIYDLTGMLVNMFPTKMDCPAYMACTPGRKIAVTDWKTSVFKIFNSSGVEIHSQQYSHFNQESMEEPYGICCDSSGNIFVADKKKSAVFVYSETGAIKHIYTAERDKVGTPFAVAVNNNGIIAVAEYSGIVRLFSYTRDVL